VSQLELLPSCTTPATPGSFSRIALRLEKKVIWVTDARPLDEHRL